MGCMHVHVGNNVGGRKLRQEREKEKKTKERPSCNWRFQCTSLLFLLIKPNSLQSAELRCMCACG